MSSSKRASTLPSAPKPPLTLSSLTTIADQVSLTGQFPITIGANTIIHPRTKLNSTFAPITIGSTCIISERCQLGLQSATENQREGVVLENGVVLEVGAVVEAKRIGEGSVVEGNARVGRGAVIGKHCKIGPLCEVASGEVVPDFTVIYGHGLRRIDRSGVEDLRLKMVSKQVEILRKLIPSNVAKYQ